MDLLLFRRRKLTDDATPLVCGCGAALQFTPSASGHHQAHCHACTREPRYEIRRDAITESGDAREVAIAAYGVMIDYEAAFEAQGFHVVRPSGFRFVHGAPSIVRELTNPDGSPRMESVDADHGDSPATDSVTKD